jgi:hypothetical protein
LTTGQLVTTEGMLISVDSKSPLAPEAVEAILRPSARNLVQVGPATVVRVQDTYSSSCSASAARVGTSYTNYRANIYLKGVNSTFANQPDAQAAHEYGHAYTLRAYYLESKRLWTEYLVARGLDGDERIGTSYAWSVQEIAADDYRLLFGSPKAISTRPKHMNTQIPAPTAVPGLGTWMKGWGG